MFFSFSDYSIKKTILIYTLSYISIVLVLKIFKHHNTLDRKISAGRGIGWLLGLTAGFYFGYHLNILAGIGSIKSSNIAVAICFACGIVNSEIGGYLAKTLLTK